MNKVNGLKYENFRCFQYFTLNSIHDMMVESALNSSHFIFGCFVTLVTILFPFLFCPICRNEKANIEAEKCFFPSSTIRKEPAKTDNKNWLCMLLRARDHKKGQHKTEREENGHDTRIRLRQVCTFAILHLLRFLHEKSEHITEFDDTNGVRLIKALDRHANR